MLHESPGHEVMFVLLGNEPKYRKEEVFPKESTMYENADSLDCTFWFNCQIKQSVLCLLTYLVHH